MKFSIGNGGKREKKQQIMFRPNAQVPFFPQINTGLKSDRPKGVEKEIWELLLNEISNMTCFFSSNNYFRDGAQLPDYDWRHEEEEEYHEVSDEVSARKF